MIKGYILLEDNRKMDFELYEDIAPISVNNFVNLAKENFYDGIIFHRVIKDFMNQCGGYYIKDRSLNEKKAKTIKGEFKENGIDNPLKHELGVLSMARTSVFDSASSQFFLCVDNCQHLDGSYAAFGKIVGDESLQVLKDINNVKVGYLSPMFTHFPIQPIAIKSIVIEE